MTRPATPLGARIGPYEIVGWLGAGGMGEVYHARDPRLGRDVALKLITGTLAADSGRVRRFEQEARAAGQLNHPNIVAVYDIGVHDGAPYIVSELLEGQSLRSRLSEGPLPWRKVLDYGRQAAEGLAAAHERGIVHRDVKPDNLFITGDGRIKILDFGIAKLAGREEDGGGGETGLPTDTAEGSVLGTAAYMSPEQVRGERVDARSDLFSLGAVLYEMVTGSPAFRRETSAETMTAILKTDPAEPAVPDAPALPRIVLRCIEKSRETRFQSARDLAFGLDVLTGSQASAALAAAAPTPRWRAALGTAIVVVGAGTATAIWWPRSTPPAAPPAIETLLAGATFSILSDFEGSKSDAAISPDGKFVAFMADRSGPFHVWLKQVGTGQSVDLTPQEDNLTNVGPNRSVGFSPEGPEIWINGSKSRPGSKERRLVLMPLLTGGTPRPFLREHAVNVTWSPDGARLAYFTYDDDPLIVADASGANEREIIPAVGGNHNHFPAFSTDGRWIYYVHGEQSVAEYDIWRIPAPGGSPERLAQLHTDVRYLTPFDAHTVLFVAPAPDRSGPWLWALDVDRQSVHRVSIGLDRYLSIAASGDRRRLVATVARSAAGLWSAPIGDRLADEHDVRPYPLPTARALAPRFGGGALFYLSSTGAGDGLWRMEKGQPLEVLKGADTSLVEPPAVSPRGDRVAVVVRTQGKLRLTLVTSDGIDPHPLSDAIDVHGTAAWSPDGNWIVTGGSDARGPGLFKIPVAGGAPVLIKSGIALDPAWSPDGTLIVYGGVQAAAAPLLAVRPDGTPVPVPDIRVPTGGRGRWRFVPSATVNRLVYMQGTLGAQDFWLLDIATKKTRQLTRLSSPAATTTSTSPRTARASCSTACANSPISS